MERFCSTCGGLVKGDVKYCPNCGSQLTGAVDLGKSDASSSYGSNMGGQVDQGYIPPMTNMSNSYQQPMSGAPRRDDVMSMGQWILTIFLCSFLGLVSIILNIFWGFKATDIPENKKTYCRAMLVINIISSVLASIFAIVFGIFIANNPDSFKVFENGFNFGFSI